MFELLGPTVDTVAREIYQGGDILEPETILRMSKQLLQAIAFLHEIGYAHGGTLDPHVLGRNFFVLVCS